MPFLEQTADQITENALSQAATPKDAAIITTLSLSTAAAATHTLTLLSPAITSKSILQVEVGNGSNTAGTPAIASVTPADNGSAAIIIQNIHSANAFNGTLKVGVIVFN